VACYLLGPNEARDPCGNRQCSVLLARFLQAPDVDTGMGTTTVTATHSSADTQMQAQPRGGMSACGPAASFMLSIPPPPRHLSLCNALDHWCSGSMLKRVQSRLVGAALVVQPTNHVQPEPGGSQHGSAIAHGDAASNGLCHTCGQVGSPPCRPSHRNCSPARRQAEPLKKLAVDAAS
jgi:hypothetical protein